MASKSVCKKGCGLDVQWADRLVKGTASPRAKEEASMRVGCLAGCQDAVLDNTSAA